MGCPSQVELGDDLTFTVTTHDPDTGVLTDADAVPSYYVYEDETTTAITSGSMAKLDDSNTTGFYAETITCSTGNGYEVGKNYNIYITATVDSDQGGISFGFNVTDVRTTLDTVIASAVVQTAVISGSYDYNLTAAQIITEAMELIGKVGVGLPISSEDQSTCLRSLEMMVKSWAGEGIGLWAEKEAFLFPQYNTNSYNIGPSGDNATFTGYKTEIATAASSGDSTITVDDDDDMTDGDYIGIELDDGTLQWTTIDGTPAANVVTLDDVLTDDVSVDSHVYNYTNLIQRPLEIIEARVHYAGDTERPIMIVSRDEYMRLSTKDNKGTPNLIYYQPTLTNGKMLIWPACSDVKEYIKFTARIQLQDFDAVANYPDFPSEWLMALAWNLAVMIAPKFGKVLDADFKMRAEVLKQLAFDSDTETTSSYLGIKQR